VVICAYNEERWDLLCEAVASVRDQTFPAHEVIVVVDHNDRLQQRARAALPSVSVVENEQRPGLSGARNAGVHHERAMLWCSSMTTHGRSPAGSAGCWHSMDGERSSAQAVKSCPDGKRSRRAGYRQFNWVVGCSYVGLPDEPREIRNHSAPTCRFAARRSRA